MVALLGSYVGCYFWAKIEVNSGDFVTANKLLFLPFITEIYDHKLVEYVDAGMMMENREYEDAVEAFGDLGSYKDAEDLMNEASYRLAMQYADHNRFSKAVNLLEDLEEIDYSDAYDKIKEVQYRWAWSLIEKGDYIDAYEKLDEIWNYPAAKETKIALKDVIYEEGQALYSNQNYDSAKEHFEYISPYLDSEKYITLIDARGYKASIDPKGTAEKLAEIFCFEDAADLLLSNTDIACYFLLGNWRTSNGSYYFKMEKTSKTEHSFYSSYNLPWYGGTFCISDGIYIVSNDSYEEKPQFGFTLLTPNSMEVYCYKNGSTYTMYR